MAWTAHPPEPGAMPQVRGGVRRISLFVAPCEPPRHALPSARRGDDMRLRADGLRADGLRALAEPRALREVSSPGSIRALSSVGSERLPYKQEVGGSNPSAPIRGDRYRPPTLARIASTVTLVRNSISFLPCSIVSSAGRMLIPLIDALSASMRSCRRTWRGSSFMMIDVM